MNRKELVLRFVFGGTAVAVSYVLSIVLPWKVFSGIFAAFPAVMIVAVMMMGMTHGSKKAAQIAHGAVYGMMGGVICVISVLTVIQYIQNWWLSIGVGLIAWYLSATLIARAVAHVKAVKRLS